jgi:uncharacterized protein with HEPN domain
LDGKTENDFLSDDLIQDAVIRNLEIIGEAVSKLGGDLKTQYSHIPWREISGMRNRLIHGYFSVNLRIVWDTVNNVLPDFMGKITVIRDDMDHFGQNKPKGISPR